MVLKIRKRPQPYTLAEIIDCDYPEQWSKAQTLSNRLAELQERINSTSSILHQQLPADVKQLQALDTQMALQNYILARSLYSFAEKVFMLLDKQCAELAKALNDYDRYAEEDALAKVERTLEILANAPLEDIASDSLTGLLRLNRVTYEFEYRLDFPVVGNWTFHDIMGAVANSGLCHEDILRVAINDTPPTHTSVGKLLDDDTMQRVY
ncbi:MAG: hypothetical protein IJX44_05295 [Bacteroidaceae bacterium]|nr:hypothetical protein [Bacteroidaceae bacterium]